RRGTSLGRDDARPAAPRARRPRGAASARGEGRPQGRRDPLGAISRAAEGAPGADRAGHGSEHGFGCRRAAGRLGCSARRGSGREPAGPRDHEDLVKTDPTFWLLARASGLTAYALLTCSVLAGLVLKSRPFGRALKQVSVTDVHRFLVLLGLGMLALHGVTL